MSRKKRASSARVSLTPTQNSQRQVHFCEAKII